ncbi:hypothetical protein [Flectobacillus major]|uniref:hypothetical protein n=1 Tax=Flectobacillus major TaxID=103 RepID=UPI000421C4D3|nr:hypothetical protein [Flectobacillus major]
MFKKHFVLIGIIVALLLLLIATLVYPGGSLSNKNAVGFDWSKNFISNLFAEKAVNGLDNPARLWADGGMIFLALSFATFFIAFSQKIPVKSASMIIRYLGAGGMVFMFLIVTPLHDIMITIASTMFLVSLFYITVFVLKSKLTLLKYLCVFGLLIFYYTLYLYGSGSYDILPIMQKVTFISTIVLILGLTYFTKKEDFEQIQ